MSNSKQKTKNTAVVGMFVAIIIVLQLLSYFIKIGTFNLSLVLVPIILVACMFGKKLGALMGAIFGVVVVICCMVGLDAGGFILFSANPILCSLICIIKGAAAGFFAGLINQPFKNKENDFIGVVLAGVVAPLANTGLFLVGLAVCFKDILYSWAGGTNIAYYMIFGLCGINFIIELVLNLVMSTAVSRVIKAVKRI